ncbi:YifB family Mg chelatase-like AAA ATPase [Deferribacterales bacterium RsTz2092]|nr:magnesium chelatase [Deferribacterales bacterium]
MFAKVASAHLHGIEAIGVSVEADMGGSGFPSFAVVGLAEAAVKEGKERVRSALKNIGLNVFDRPIVVNLAPADIKKEGSHFDLPIAIGLLAALEPEKYNLESTLIVGELSLDGALRGVAGVLCICSWAKDNGFKRVILPLDNADEAVLTPELNVYPFKHLTGVVQFLQGELKCEPHKRTSNDSLFDTLGSRYSADFSEIKGQYAARRAAEIASAGMHNIIMMGTPGSGKTMLASRIPTILPPMTLDEALLTTKVHSIAGLLRVKGSLVHERPFIAPHHTASNVAIIGGGAKAMPGHVSIATNGVLFLDEMLEFNRSVLEVLRQPLEDGKVTIARAGRTVSYPAQFMLVAACNPCPCGYYGDAKKKCVCSEQSIERYRARLSGPLLDRIDLQVHVASVEVSALDDDKCGESSQDILKRVVRAHKIQSNRFAGMDIHFNSQMSERVMQECLNIDDGAKKLAINAAAKFNLSARAYNKVLKISRTIADLADSASVEPAHVSESLQYRMLDKQ